VIALIRLYLAEHLVDAWKALERSCMERDPVAKSYDPFQSMPWILQCNPADETMNVVSLREKEFSEI